MRASHIGYAKLEAIWWISPQLSTSWNRVSRIYANRCTADTLAESRQRTKTMNEKEERRKNNVQSSPRLLALSLFSHILGYPLRSMISLCLILPVVQITVVISSEQMTLLCFSSVPRRILTESDARSQRLSQWSVHIFSSLSFMPKGGLFRMLNHWSTFALITAAYEIVVISNRWLLNSNVHFCYHVIGFWSTN